AQCFLFLFSFHLSAGFNRSRAPSNLQITLRKKMPSDVWSLPAGMHRFAKGWRQSERVTFEAFSGGLSRALESMEALNSQRKTSFRTSNSEQTCSLRLDSTGASISKVLFQRSAAAKTILMDGLATCIGSATISALARGWR